MDAKLLRYYNQELLFMREMGAEFAHQFPKIAGRLNIDGFDCSDPYVERLLEGFAFMAARVQLKVDSQFPNFTQHLLEVVFPNYTAPTPTMAIAQFTADPTEGDLSSGFLIERGATLKSKIARDQKSRCEFRTAHDVTLWPIEISDVDYFTSRGALQTLGINSDKNARAGMRIKLRAQGEIALNELPLDELSIYLRGSDGIAGRLYEQIVGNSLGMVVRSSASDAGVRLPKNSIVQQGFSDDEALLPSSAREFQGYRLLHEYFAFHQRFHFIKLTGLQNVVRTSSNKEFEIIVLLDRSDESLDRILSADNFSLHCTPIINLFERRADRIHIDKKVPEYHLVPDRTRPMDYEVYSIQSVAGYGKSGDKERDFVPFYSMKDRNYRSQSNAYFSIKRQPRLLSERQKRYGSRTSYLGSEVYISLVDEQAAPFSSELRQLAITTLCTNRDLPMLIPLGEGESDFDLQSGAPVATIRCLDGPSKPTSATSDGSTPWRLISHLSLNYLSLMDTEEVERGAALREMLGLYANLSDPASRKQIEGVVSCSSQPIVRRMPVPGPLSFGRGLQIEVGLEESAFEGIGVFLLGAVLERFFARYTSLNSFTETVVTSTERGEVMQWPTRTGTRIIA